jgi:uncharacterized RDD family membrane protein YckC
VTDAAPSNFPGERLGLPEQGRGSVGRLGRRILALFIDWFITVGISWLITHQVNDWSRYPIFVALQIIAIWTIGGSIGHRIVGLRLSALPGSQPAFWRPVVRSVLLGIVIPALVWDSDHRGFHDKIAGTVLVRA